jgi:hypothetical protein
MATTIAIQDGSGAPPRRVTKLIPYRAGGFAVLVPYHSARKGYLAKHTVDYRQSDAWAHRSAMQEYSASDRVKLSFHPDGFVQFSGENPGRITSGRDPVTGEPRGLGLLLEHQLNRPILSGPTFSITVWGLGDFVEETDSGTAVVFRQEDCYLRGCLPDAANGYAIEGFVFPLRYLSAARQVGGQLRLSLACMLFEATAGVLDFVVLPLPDQPIVVGLVASRLQVEFPESSGFALTSPSDRREGSPIANALLAVYPEQMPGPPGATLDFTGA